MSMGVTVTVCKLRSRDGKQDRLVAVKRLKPNSSIDLSELANEARILRSLRHRCAFTLSLRSSRRGCKAWHAIDL